MGRSSPSRDSGVTIWRASPKNGPAVAELLRWKHRDQKPLAIMVSDLEAVRLLCDISPQEEAVLMSPGRPIVVLRRRSVARVRYRPWLPETRHSVSCFRIRLFTI